MRIKRAFKSIQSVVAVAVILAALVTIGVGYLTMDLVHHEIERQLDHRIELEVDNLLDAYESGGLQSLIVEVKRREKRLVPGRIGYLVGVSNESRMMGVFVADADGKRLAGSLRAGIPEPGWSEFLSIIRKDGSVGRAQAMNTILPDGNQLVVVADRAMLHQVDRRLTIYFLCGLGLIMGVSAGAAFFIGRFVQKRLGFISDAANAIIAGDIQRRIRRDGSGSEFDRLSDVLNRMLDRISTLLGNLRQVTENIAHDMRTPLQRLRQNLEAAESEQHGEIAARKVRESLQEVDRLLELFGSLLAISEIDGHRVRSRFARLNLAGLAHDVVEAYGPAFKAASIELDEDLHDCWVLGDKSLLQQCVANLLDNILIHAAGATRAHVSVSCSAQDVHLRVLDNGAGIPEEARDRIFERFVRLDPSRSTPGHGLGLSLVASIASAHHGVARANRTPDGLEIDLSFPAGTMPEAGT